METGAEACGNSPGPTPGTSLILVRRLVAGYVAHYNNVRLNSAIGYITPKDMLAGRQQEIHAERDRKLEVARKRSAGQVQTSPYNRSCACPLWYG
jgi:hypothetical protein